MKFLHRTLLLAAAIALSVRAPVRAADVSPPVILQYFESQWSTMEKRMPDVFMAGYGAIWTPPPGRALYDDQGGGIGYNIYDRFDLGKANDPTLYGTEKSYRTLIGAAHRTNSDAYVDYVHHHVGSWDVPSYTGANGYTPESWQHVQDTRDYPGFQLSEPYTYSGANYRDTYPDPTPDSDVNGMNDPFEYEWRLAHLITIDLTSGRSFVRNPVPGNAQNIPQAPAGYAIATSTLNGNTPGNSTVVRQANTPTDDNKRFYPDQNLSGITVTDNGQQYTIHPFNTSDPTAGDPTAETSAGYMMRYAQWLINDVGVDGLRIDAARHVPHGTYNDPDAPIDIPALIDRAVYRQNRRTNLDGSTRNVFSFQEVFTADKAFNQNFIRKDITSPSVVGGNRDVLDFPLWFAMRQNLTSNGLNNNWYNIRNASQDIQDDGLANNGSQSIAFVINHDDGRGDTNNQGGDYIYLDNVAHAWVLTRPGNAYVYYNAHEFDRTGNNTFFLKDGRGDALGGQYGTIITKLLDIRNSYGRGNFQERWIDGGNFSNIYAYERDRSMLVGLNSALGTVTDFDERTMYSGFQPNTHLVELTGNADDPTIDQNNAISNVLVTFSTDNGTLGASRVTMRIPRSENTSGNIHGKGYVIYGLPRPQGPSNAPAITLTGVSQTLAGSGTNAANNATSRINDIDVVTANNFNITLSTKKVTLSDGYHDQPADGDNALLRLDEGLDLNNNGHVDYTAPGTSIYGFEEFTTTHSPGYFNASGDGTYTQSVNATSLSEGYHYITARAFRQRSDGGPDIFTDFRKVIYVDRLPPTFSIDSIAQSGSGGGRQVSVGVRSTDLTADNVHVIMDLGAAKTDAQILAMLNSTTAATQTDRDLFAKTASVINGTHVMTIVTREITGNYSIVRATGLGVTGGLGLGFGDLDFNGVVNSSDISNFQSVLESNNQTYHSAAEANTDGLINLTDTFLLGPRLTTVGADAATVTSYNSMTNSAFVTSGTYTVDANQTVYNVTAGTTHVLPNVTLTARSIRGNNATLDSNSRIAMSAKNTGGAVSRVATLNIAPNAALDLNDNDLIVTNMSRADIETLVTTGRAAGSWQGPGITSAAAAARAEAGTHALGVIAAGDASYSSFDSQPVASTDVLVKYTYAGDADLSGTVNFDDFNHFLAGFTHAQSARWFTGDFNYSGAVDFDDFNKFIAGLGAFNSSGIVIAPSERFASAAIVTDSGSPVPEPAALGLIVSAASLLMRRRAKS